MESVEQEVGEALRELGFSVNESRAYVALLRESPATGYELSRRAAIPRSAIYGVLRRLSDGGLVFQVSEKPARYSPLPPSDLTRLLKRRFEQSLGQLEDKIELLDAPPVRDELWQVQGYGDMLEEARALVQGAESTLYMSLWRREALRLKDDIAAAVARGVDVVAFSFCDVSELSEVGATAFAYGLPADRLEDFWRHRLLVVADRERVLLGEAEEQDGTVSVRTGNRTIADLVTTQIVMDLTLLGERRGIDLGLCVARMQGARLGRLGEVLDTIEPTSAGSRE